MEMMLREIERALEARLYYSAVIMALTLPDVCAALESEDARTTKQRYMAWYRANIGAAYGFMTDEDCYSLRCGVVHQGRFGGHGMRYGRVVFTMPIPERNIVIHNNVMNDALNLDANVFCRDLIAAVRRWFAAHSQEANVQANLPNLVQLREDGLAPYIVGLPVIA
jgi:hypothetical protein